VANAISPFVHKALAPALHTLVDASKAVAAPMTDEDEEYRPRTVDEIPQEEWEDMIRDVLAEPLN